MWIWCINPDQLKDIGQCIKQKYLSTITSNWTESTLSVGTKYL